MKSLPLTLFLFLFLAFRLTGQNNVGINDDNSTAKASAMLDIFSSTKGLLIPRVVLTSTTLAAPVTSPEASLLIYNTAITGDVTPGYYYWNGSTKWVRLVAYSDPAKTINTVIKSASATLLKTENMVFASGDITLTLPVITSADDGLEIAVKNIGTYTDLIIVVPESGKLIDANATSSLTRWHGRTFIANGSNWIIKEKEIQTDNNLEVSTIGSFTTIPEVVAFLNSHMSAPTVVILGAGTYPITAVQTINLPYPVTFQGLSFGETTINATAGVSGSPLFICQTECYFMMITFNAISNAAGNDAIQFTASGKYYEAKDCKFIGFNKGIVSTNNNSIWIFDADFKSITGAGIEIAAGTASGGSIKVSESDFTQCVKGISLLSGVAEIVAITNCTFYNTVSGTDIGILYTPATFTSFSTMFITNNSWNVHGTYISGFDFTRPDGRDANIFLMANAGLENKQPHCKISVLNCTDTTKISTANVYRKANFTTTTSYTCKLTIVNNSVTYQPVYRNDINMIISGNISVKNSGKTINFGICKNGVISPRYGESTLYAKDGGQAYQFSTVVYLSDVGPTDYFELFVTSSSNGDILTIQDLNWLVVTN